MTMELDSRQLVFGWNDEPGLVALEPAAAEQDEMRLFFRTEQGVVQRREPFQPFFWLNNPGLLSGAPGPCALEPLAGNNPFSHLALFPTWKAMEKTLAWLKKGKGIRTGDPGGPLFLLNDPAQQHLLLTGRTLFKGMTFGQLRRLQVDIETFTDPAYEFSNALRESDRIIAIALADSTGWAEVLRGDRLEEKALLEQFVSIVRERDPDVIEGHNLFKFDLPYLQTRARRHKVALVLGRDGSEPATHPSRFIMADQTLAYPRCEIFGRHVVDTYFLAQAYDVSHRSLESFGLKSIARHFGVAAQNRVYIEGGQIASQFLKDPDLLMKYALDDIRETEAISRILSPSYFAQAQILPFSYQNICVRGNGTKIDALLLREYLRQRTSLPIPGPARSFEGGYTDIFATGVLSNVHHCDVRSLYPSLILKDRRGPASDSLGVFLRLLDYLRQFRLEEKRKMQESRTPEERIHHDALQSTFKILINSFYGYLAFSQGHFNDFSLAETITAGGRALLQHMIHWLEAHGARPIEIDTDGIYFIPPAGMKADQQAVFRRTFQESLPQGIEVEFDGEYRAMFSYKMKNYALLADSDEIIIKGAALKSRGLEPFQRDFMREWLRLTLLGKSGEIPGLCRRYREAIRGRQWPITRLAKSETLQESPSTYQGKIQGGDRGRNAAYELALRSGREYQAGDQVSYYVTGHNKRVAVHSSAKLVGDWDEQRRDENVEYYVAKLDALIKKFDGGETQEDGGHLELDFGGPAKGKTNEAEA